MPSKVALKPGDLITLKMQCVDKKVILYYKTLALMGDTGPGGSTTPNNPPNNITSGAIGVFSARKVQEKSKVFKGSLAYTRAVDLYEVPDKGILALVSNPYTIDVKCDANGNELWRKQFDGVYLVKAFNNGRIR